MCGVFEDELRRRREGEKGGLRREEVEERGDGYLFLL